MRTVARERGAGDDEPLAAETEHAVHGQAKVGGRWRGGGSGELVGDRAAQSLQPSARRRRHRNDRCGRERRAVERHADLVDDGPYARLVDQVDLRDRDQPARHPEQMEDVEVLLGLRHDAVVRRDDEQRHVDAVRPSEHVADEALVPGDVDDAGPLAAGEIEMREAEVDRDAALLLLLQAIRVLPGEGAHQRGLPVIDVSGRADDGWHLRSDL
jgi:hypothetical protein